MATDFNKLQAENLKLQRRLKSLMDNARLNEEKLSRFSEMELQLISTHSLRDLFQIIITNYKNSFNLAKVSLVFIDADYELLRFLDETGLQLDQLPELRLEAEPEKVKRWFDHKLLPVLSSFNSEHQNLFPNDGTAIESVALVPLVRQGRLIGSLNLASNEIDRFQSSNSTDFLQRLAAIISICFENALNVTRLERVGMTDPLTCVYNRRFFEQRLNEVVSSSVRYHFELSCMFLDVDFFKKVNDQLGHQVGDLVLQEVAVIINQHLRGSDMVARYGGEEFVVLLPQTPLAQATLVAERIRKSLDEYRFTLAGGKTLAITISIGVAGMHTNDMSFSSIDLGRDLVKRADQALLQAKANGRNQVIESSQSPEYEKALA